MKFVVLMVAFALSIASCSAQTEIESLKARALEGDAEAQYNLGMKYAYGEGVAKNDVEAVKWYRLAAVQGEAGAQSTLGVKYDVGEGVVEDDAEAVKWYRLAADQGESSAQLNLGAMYADGKGVPQDDVQAYKWWNLAAAQGDDRAKAYKSFVEEKMTREQIAEAQKLSSQWKPRGSK
jgi:TPR repeat protein